MSLRTRLAALLCVAFVALALPAGVAVAQISGGGGQLGAPEPAPVAPTPIDDPTDDGWQDWQTALVTFAGLILIVGIGVAIVGDARRAAPVDDEDRFYREQTSADEELKSNPRAQQAKARARAKAKVARQSRKRNRVRR